MQYYIYIYYYNVYNISALDLESAFQIRYRKLI
jgi:hypothetical protein